jgi:hypothetical protein
MRYIEKAVAYALPITHPRLQPVALSAARTKKVMA